MITSKVGLEAEFVVLGNEGTPLFYNGFYAPSDGFPLLLEIRGLPGTNVADTIANFEKEKIRSQEWFSKDKERQFAFVPFATIPHKLYKEVMRCVEGSKYKNYEKIKNIYDIDLSELTDVVVENGKVIGVNISCGLHVHFSCFEESTATFQEHEYIPISLPISAKVDGESLCTHTIDLFRRKYSTETKKTVTARASRITKPAIHYIVREMDDAIYEKYGPKENGDRTKFRRRGFYEIKEYGFEYRSLPADDRTISSEGLREIVGKAFELLEDINGE